MDKIFSKTSIILAGMLSVITFFFGDFTKLLITLIAIIITDYITGVLKAIFNKSVSSEIGAKGIIKKAFIFCIVAVAHMVQSVIGTDVPIRDIVICFYLANEGISILENSAEFIPIPDKLKDILIQIRKKGDDDNG